MQVSLSISLDSSKIYRYCVVRSHIREEGRRPASVRHGCNLASVRVVPCDPTWTQQPTFYLTCFRDSRVHVGSKIAERNAQIKECSGCVCMSCDEIRAGGDGPSAVACSAPHRAPRRGWFFWPFSWRRRRRPPRADIAPHGCHVEGAGHAACRSCGGARCAPRSPTSSFSFCGPLC